MILLDSPNKGKITESNECYHATGNHHWLTIDEVQDIELNLNGSFYRPEDTNKSDIKTIESDGVTILGNNSHLMGTRLKLQLKTRNVTLKDIHVSDALHTSFSHQYYVDSKHPYDPNFNYGHFVMENCSSKRSGGEGVYLGAQQDKTGHKQFYGFESIYVRNFKSYKDYREGYQIAHCEDVDVQGLELIDPGQGNEVNQNSALQVSNIYGKIKDVTIPGCKGDGIRNWSYGVTYENIQVDHCQTAFFFGRHDVRFPNSDLTGGDVVIYGANVDGCAYLVQCNTDEMNIYFVDCKFNEANLIDIPKDFLINPDSTHTDNIHFINN